MHVSQDFPDRADIALAFCRLTIYVVWHGLYRQPVSLASVSHGKNREYASQASSFELPRLESRKLPRGLEAYSDTSY